jgi:hypothetical protein
MFKPTANSRALWQGLALASVIAGSAATASSAFAGECPADKMKVSAREKVDFKPVGVTDVTLGSIDLEKQPAPVAPVAPVAPACPVAPVGPNEPVAPVGPATVDAAPAAPVAPCA